jgi:prophage DNA circulation protein
MSKFTPRIDEFWINIIDSGVTNTKERSVVTHDIPFGRRNLVQDTGAVTNTYSFTVAFHDNPPLAPGQDLENRALPTYETRLPFLELLNSGKSLIFQHPSEGIVDVRVQSISENETSTINYMEISLELVKEVDEISSRDVKYPIEENASSFRASTAVGETKVSALRKAASVINSVQIEGRLNQYTDKLNSLFSDVDSLSNSIINTINYAEGTAGDLLLTLNNTVDRMIQAQKDVLGTPATFINNMITQTRALASNFLELGQIPTFEFILTLGMSTSRIAVEIAETYVNDDKNQEKVLKNVGVATYDNKGNYIGTPEVIDVMTINELESTVSSYRQLADDVIQLDRDNRDIQDEARVLQTFVDENKLGREQIITVSVNAISIYALLNKFNLSYQEADRIFTLNPQIRNPNFMTGDIRLVVPSA